MNFIEKNKNILTFLRRTAKKAYSIIEEAFSIFLQTGGEFMDDMQIIELYFERNENAIAQTEIKYGGLCQSIIKNILNNNEDSQQCVNDTLYGVWNAIPPAKPINFKAFLCKIARNLALKRLDYNLASKRSHDCTVSLSELEDTIPDNSIKFDVSDEDIGEHINRFLQNLKPDARNVFVRKYWFFDSVSDIASRYNFTESKVKNLLYHTRNKLRDHLMKEGICL